MAGAAALAARRQIQVQFAELGCLADVIVPHQTVEIERGRGAGIGFDRADFRQPARYVGDRKQRALGVFQRGALGQIDHHRHFRLVVERQQLHRHRLGDEQNAHRQRRDPDADEENPGALAAAQDRAGEAAVEPAEQAFAMRGLVLVHGFAFRVQAQHQPGRDRHGDEEREQHGGRGVGRDRRHIGTHQAGHEQHRQQRGHHGERGDDGGIADLGHRLDRALQPRAAVAHGPMAGDVLHHDDGVIHQNADGEDQREQADAVDGVAHQLGGKEREQDGGRDHHGRHQRLAPADGEGDQHHDGDGGKAEMKQQLVGLVVGGLAVVARDGDIEVGGDEPPAHVLQARQQVLGHHHGVGAGPFGKGDADRRHAVPLLALWAVLLRLLEPDAVLLRARPDHHLADIADIDRTVVAGGDQ